MRELHYGILSLFKYQADSYDGKQAWPPNAKEFLMLCRYRSSDFGLPCVSDAYRAAQSSLNRPCFIWPHTCVYLAATEVGALGLREDTPQNYYRFKQSYEIVMQRAMCGADLGCAPMYGIISDEATASHPDVAVKHIQACFNTLHGRKTA